MVGVSYKNNGSIIKHSSKLYDLDKLGVKIKLYIENSAFYEYWRVNRFIYNNEFRRFLT